VKWGLDGAYPPDQATAEAWFGSGWSFFCGYVGGHAAHVWTPEDFQRVAAAGFALLPIFVAPLVEDAGYRAGADDGNACLEAMQARGLSGQCALDVENGLTPNDYAMGFLDASTVGSLGVVLYGTQGTIAGLGHLDWSAWWLANWPAAGQGVHQAPPDFSIWQFQEGPAADFNVCVDDFQFAELAS
jgi:hypothetical protein